MPDLTTRYGLKKPVPDGSETADLRVWVGENMDLLDVVVGHVEDKADAAGQAAATAQQTANAAQQAASAAQAAADAAQETADTALSTAQAAQSAADTAQQAAMTAQAIAEAAIPRGETDNSVSLVRAVLHHVHGRSVVLVYDDTGNLVRVEERAGETVVKTTDLSYGSDGRLVVITETADGVSVPRRLVYGDDGSLIRIEPV